MNMKTRCRSSLYVFLILSICWASSSMYAQETGHHARLSIQWSEAVDGPWEPVPRDNQVITDASEIAVVSDSTQRYLRVGMSSFRGMTGEVARLPVSQAPASAVALATNFIREWVGTPDPDDLDVDPDGEDWTRAKLAPYAIKVFDPSYRNGGEPAYLEFKVVADPAATNTPIYFGRPSETSTDQDLGFILVSLHEGDYPQPVFATRGSTPYEELLARVPSSVNPRIVRYGDAFSAVEDRNGALLATFGSPPFRVVSNVTELIGRTYSGEFDSDTATTNLLHGQGGPSRTVGFYETYADFRRDYETNDYYQLLRENRAKSAAGDWDALKGIFPPEPDVWQVNIRETITKLDGQTVTRVFLDDDVNESTNKLAVFVSGGAGAGLQITGLATGGAPVIVETLSGGVTSYFLRVVAGGAGRPANGGSNTTTAFTPGWQPWKKWFASPDGYAGMANYSQPLENQWCDAVGCGPIAWAILIHWWEVHGVPSSYYIAGNEFSFINEGMSPNYPTYYLLDFLHDACDVICDPFSDCGGTWPSDMIEAGPAWFWLPKNLLFMKYKYNWAWDTGDTDWNEPANRIRTAIKNGRPAIIGLGWLWHYGVAYGYRAREYKATENGPAIKVQRRFKVNEGWARGKGVWYYAETFLGADIQAKQLKTTLP